MHTLPGHSNWVGSVAFSQDGKRVASGSLDHLVKIWNSETGAEVGNPGECTWWCEKLQAFWRWLNSCFGVNMV